MFLKASTAILGICVPVIFGLNSATYATNIQLQSLNDEELSEINGQALMSLSYLAPNDANNKMSGAGVGFYKLGMEAELDLNANINRLQLGCGGPDGQDACDIDIDNLSLSGIADTRDGRAGSSAKLTNPFLEFAIKNPDSASTREIVGLRLSAEKLVGLLTLGTGNTDNPNGINSLSGFLKVQSGIGSTEAERSKIKGYADTAAQYMDLEQYPILGKLNATLLGVTAATASFKTNGGGFNIPSMTNLPFETPQIVVSGKRQTSIGLSASVAIPTIYLGTGSNYPTLGRTINDAYGTTNAVYTSGSPVDAVITGCTGPLLNAACLLATTGREFTNIEMSGNVSGAKATVNFQESLGFIHKLEINSATSLSLQTIQMLWPGSEAANVAQPGWWLAMQDPVNIGRVEPAKELGIEPLLGQFASRAGDYLQAHPAQTSDIGGILLGDGLAANIGNVDLSNVNPLQMNLSNLRLSGQDFVPNCYGNLVFC